MKKFKFGITVLVILTIIVVLAACQPSNPTLQPAGKVTVVFDLNGGEMSEQSSVQVDKGSYLQLPVPTRTGYSFIGWFVGEGVNAGQVTNTTAITQDITITAHWKANNYTVSFVETGDNSIADVSVTYGQDCTLPTPKRTGYTFLGWFDGEDKVESGVWNIARNTTLVAHWQANTYTVTLDTATDEKIDQMEMIFDQPYTLPTPIRVGYTFDGWYNGSTKVELSGKWGFTRNISLLARWIETEYSVIYNNTEGCYNNNPNSLTISRLPYVLQDAGKNDHLFEGWYADPDFTTRVTQIDQLGMTLYAKFTVATSGFQFKTTENGVAVTGYNGTESDIIIPSYHNGFVTSIGGSAFNEHSVTSVVIPTSVTSIGESAFSGCRNLINVVIPSSVTSIEANAFYGCYRLTSVIIPLSVISVGQDVFANCSRLTIYCGEEGHPIGWNADWNPSNRPVVWGIKGVGSTAEYDYVLVEEGICLSKWKGPDTIVTVPSEIDGFAVVDLGQAFAHSNVVAVKILSNVKSVAKSAFYGCSSLVSVEIPTGVTSIGSSAFSDCSSLESIEIPTGVTSIGENAFWNCSSLASIVIPVGVTCISDGTFYGCSDLTSIVIPLSVTSIGNSAFSGCSSLIGVVIPSGVTSIANDAFKYCSSLVSIEIPSCVTNIEGGTFYGCSDLTSIVIPSSVTNIGSSAFYGCSSLVSVEIPTGVTSIGDNAFYDCSILVSVVIPSSVTSIGYSAFGNCKNLTIYCRAESKPSGWNTNWNGSLFDIVRAVVWGVKGNGITADYDYVIVEGGIYLSKWKGADNIVVVPSEIDGLAVLGFGTIFAGSNVVAVEIQSGITKIGNKAFYGCGDLANIVIPTSVTSIGENAFWNCSSLASIVIPVGVTCIADGTFYGCSDLTSIVIPNGVTSIGSKAFFGCSSLASVVITSSVKTIDSYAFYNCNNLTIYCEAESQPIGWNDAWNFYNCPVVWGYKG